MSSSNEGGCAGIDIEDRLEDFCMESAVSSSAAISSSVSTVSLSSATTPPFLTALGAGPVNTCDLMLPNVNLSFKDFVPRVHLILESHNGQMPLLSFLDCYNSSYSMQGKSSIFQPLSLCGL